MEEEFVRHIRRIISVKEVPEQTINYFYAVCNLIILREFDELPLDRAIKTDDLSNPIQSCKTSISYDFNNLIYECYSYKNQSGTISKTIVAKINSYMNHILKTISEIIISKLEQETVMDYHIQKIIYSVFPKYTETIKKISIKKQKSKKIKVRRPKSPKSPENKPEIFEDNYQSDTSDDIFTAHESKIPRENINIINTPLIHLIQYS